MRRRTVLCLLALGGAAAPAAATLGEAVPPATAPRATIAAARPLAGGVQVLERRSSDGGLLREFVAPSGVVFEVRWSTRLKPRLETLLGRYQADYDQAAAQARRRPGVPRQVTLRAQDLVVESSAHLNHFSGRAWVPSLVPAGFDGRSNR